MARSISIHAPVKGATDLTDTELSIMGISIHAPVKGATETPPGRWVGYHISIHAPVKGATPGFGDCQGRGRYFNPRTREGCDSRFGSGCITPVNFNPRTREGCDSLQIGSVTICSLINHIAN